MDAASGRETTEEGGIKAGAAVEVVMGFFTMENTSGVALDCPELERMEWGWGLLLVLEYWDILYHINAREDIKNARSIKEMWSFK